MLKLNTTSMRMGRRTTPRFQIDRRMAECQLDLRDEIDMPEYGVDDNVGQSLQGARVGDGVGRGHQHHHDDDE